MRRGAPTSTHGWAQSIKTRTARDSLALDVPRCSAKGLKPCSSAARLACRSQPSPTTTAFYDSIGAEGAAALAEAVKSNSTLTTLSLAHNSFGAEGAAALAEALRSNFTLTTLYLGSNHIGKKEKAWLRSVSAPLPGQTCHSSIRCRGLA